VNSSHRKCLSNRFAKVNSAQLRFLIANIKSKLIFLTFAELAVLHRVQGRDRADDGRPPRE